MIVLLLLLFLVQAPAATTDSPTLLNEQGANARFRGGILELRGGSGWLRTMRARIQGNGEMEAVVLADGTVGPVRVTRSLNKGLDIAAVAALRAWRFRPAVLNGSAVPTRVAIEMTFTLH